MIRELRRWRREEENQCTDLSPATQQVGGQAKRLTETKTGVSPGHVVQAERSNTSQLKGRAVRAGAEMMSRKVGLGRKAWLDFVGGQTDKPGAGGGPVNFRDASGALMDELAADTFWGQEHGW